MRMPSSFSFEGIIWKKSADSVDAPCKLLLLAARSAVTMRSVTKLELSVTAENCLGSHSLVILQGETARLPSHIKLACWLGVWATRYTAADSRKVVKPQRDLLKSYLCLDGVIDTSFVARLLTSFDFYDDGSRSKIVFVALGGSAIPGWIRSVGSKGHCHSLCPRTPLQFSTRGVLALSSC